MSPGGQPPLCARCDSLERQRAIHQYLSWLPGETLSWRRALHFADDRSLDAHWFRAYEPSRYRGENSLSLEAIDRPAASYDFVMANHVLEEVQDDVRGFRELIRILTPPGVLALTFGGQLQRARTEPLDPGRSPWGAHRIYGRDLLCRFPVFEMDLRLCAVGIKDPVTGMADRLLLFARSEAALLPLAEAARTQGLAWLIW